MSRGDIVHVHSCPFSRMPWHHLRQILTASFTTLYQGTFHGPPRHTMKPYLYPLPYPRCRGQWGSVGVGLAWCEVAMECYCGGCHGTTNNGVPRPPPRLHGILCHAMRCRCNAMVSHRWYHGYATRLPNSLILLWTEKSLT